MIVVIVGASDAHCQLGTDVASDFPFVAEQLLHFVRRQWYRVCVSVCVYALLQPIRIKCLRHYSRLAFGVYPMKIK